MTDPAHQVEPLMTADEVAAVLRVHVNWIYQKVSDGTLKSCKVGHLRRFRVSDVEAFIEERVDEKMATVTTLERRSG